MIWKLLLIFFWRLLLWRRHHNKVVVRSWGNICINPWKDRDYLLRYILAMQFIICGKYYTNTKYNRTMIAWFLSGFDFAAAAAAGHTCVVGVRIIIHVYRIKRYILNIGRYSWEISNILFDVYIFMPMLDCMLPVFSLAFFPPHTL